jgi:hypothetical protein
MLADDSFRIMSLTKSPQKPDEKTVELVSIEEEIAHVARKEWVSGP